MSGGQIEMIAERMFSLGFVGAIAAAQALVAAIILSGNRRAVLASPAIKSGAQRGVFGIFVLIAVFAVGGDGLGEKPVLIAIFFALGFVMFLQIPIVLGLALHRHGRLTWPVSLAVFAWTTLACVYWAQAVY